MSALLIVSREQYYELSKVGVSAAPDYDAELRAIQRILGERLTSHLVARYGRHGKALKVHVGIART